MTVGGQTVDVLVDQNSNQTVRQFDVVTGEDVSDYSDVGLIKKLEEKYHIVEWLARDQLSWVSIDLQFEVASILNDEGQRSTTNYPHTHLQSGGFFYLLLMLSSTLFIFLTEILLIANMYDHDCW